MIKVLSMADLMTMPKGTIITEGFGTYPRIYKDPIRWVAVMGGNSDWCIYYGLFNDDWPVSRVLLEGDKVCGDDNIRYMVPCDDEAFERYRK